MEINRNARQINFEKSDSGLRYTVTENGKIIRSAFMPGRWSTEVSLQRTKDSLTAQFVK